MAIIVLAPEWAFSRAPDFCVSPFWFLAGDALRDLWRVTNRPECFQDASLCCRGNLGLHRVEHSACLLSSSKSRGDLRDLWRLQGSTEVCRNSLTRLLMGHSAHCLLLVGEAIESFLTQPPRLLHLLSWMFGFTVAQVPIFSQSHSRSKH